MRIVMFSITPLFPDIIMGGAQKHIQDIALYLGGQGHEITILCTRRDDDHRPFRWQDRVEVKPILRFRQPFPQPYATPAHHLAAIVQDVGEHLQNADRFYLHDGEFVFPYVYRHIPTVVSLRDNVYPETLQGAFLFGGDALILISDYARRHYLHTVGRFFPGLEEKIVVIPNGFDRERFKPTPPRRIRELIPSVDPQKHAIVLHPHRPETNKGLRETVQVVDLLVHRHGLSNVRALVPKWIPEAASLEVNAFYAGIEREIAERGLGEHFVFHDWVPPDLMAEYYTLGDVTLSLGSFPEAFGNAVYESLGCGTPSIAARVTTHREILPDHLLDKVDFGDVESAAAIAAQIIREKRRTSPETLAYLREHYSFERMLKRYADVILNARLTEKLTYRLTPIGGETRFTLAPWCYFSERRGLYHDFRADYRPADALRSVSEKYPQGFTFEEAARHGLSREEVMAWYREGYLVPVADGG